MHDSTAPENTLGKRFCNSREALGMSVGEVAERLHIIPKYVKCIESNEYSQLPGVVFLKGYVRAYARLLGLPEDQVVAQLDQALEASGNYAASADRFAAIPPASVGVVRKWLILLLPVLVVFVGMWYWVNRADINFGDGFGQADVAESAPETLDAAVASEISETSEIPGVPATAEEPEKPGNGVPTFAEEQSLASSAEDTEAWSDPPAKQERIPIDITFRETVPVEPIPAEPDSTRDVIPDESGSASETRTAEGQPEVTVSARFTGDCWFDIRDANNERVVQLFRAGQQVSFSGIKPVRIIAGAVDKVGLAVDGNPIDLGRYPVRNNRVEIVLEP
jgi:cytoskeleton protein RodZ